MDKSKKTKAKYNSYNHIAVKAVSKKWDMSPQYVRQCLRGDRKSLSADSIRSDYAALVKEVETLIEKQ